MEVPIVDREKAWKEWKDAEDRRATQGQGNVIEEDVDVLVEVNPPEDTLPQPVERNGTPEQDFLSFLAHHLKSPSLTVLTPKTPRQAVKTRRAMTVNRIRTWYGRQCLVFGMAIIAETILQSNNRRAGQALTIRLTGRYAVRYRNPTATITA